MSLGLVTMRRCTTRPNWLAVEEVPANVKEHCGADIEARFEACDFAASHDDESLLDAKLRCSEQARLEYQCEPDGPEWRMATSQLRLDGKLPFISKTDPFTAGLLIRFNGETTLRNLLPDFANALGADIQNVAPACIKIVRQLLERGFLRP
jgi:hypothetical protein